MSTFTSNQLCGCTSRTCNLSTFTWFHLDTVNDTTDRDVAQWQTVTWFNISILTRYQRITSFNTFRGDNVATLTVSVHQQSDVRGAVWIIFQTLNGSRDIQLVATEINNTVMLLMTATNVTSRNATIGVTTTGFAFLFDQSSVWLTLVQIRCCHRNYMTAPSGGRFRFNNSHNSNPSYSPSIKSMSWPSARHTYALRTSERLPIPR